MLCPGFEHGRDEPLHRGLHQPNKRGGGCGNRTGRGIWASSTILNRGLHLGKSGAGWVDRLMEEWIDGLKFGSIDYSDLFALPSSSSSLFSQRWMNNWWIDGVIEGIHSTSSGSGISDRSRDPCREEAHPIHNDGIDLFSPTARSSTHLLIHSFNHPSIDRSIHPSIHLLIHPSIHPPVHPSIDPSIHSSARPSICLDSHASMTANVILPPYLENSVII